MEKENTNKISDNDLQNVAGGGYTLCSSYKSEGACLAAGYCIWSSKQGDCHEDGG